MKKRTPLVMAVIIGLLLAMVGPAYADGIIIPEPPIPCPRCPPPPPITEIPNLAIKYHRVKVTIEDQVATTHVDQVFVNESPWELEGTYIFPLPEEAAISEFAMYVFARDAAAVDMPPQAAERTDQALTPVVDHDLVHDIGNVVLDRAHRAIGYDQRARPDPGA